MKQGSIDIARALLADSPMPEVDLRDVTHDRHANAPWPDHLFLTWALLSMQQKVVRVRLPEERAARVFLERAGVLTAARRRSLELVGGDSGGSDQDLRPRLANDDWQVEAWDAAAVAADPELPRHLRVMKDLEDPARVPYVVNDRGRSFLWLDQLGMLSDQLGAHEYQTLVADIDTTMYELIDNVHRWSCASRAIAVVAVTRGGGEESFNRLHLIVVDNGRGIMGSIDDDPPARLALEAQISDGYTDRDRLLSTLLTSSFGDRPLPGHQGQGLHSSQVCGSRWGRLDLFTAQGASDGHVVRHLSAAGPSNVRLEAPVTVPGLTGTALHVTFEGRVPHGERMARGRPELAGTS